MTKKRAIAIAQATLRLREAGEGAEESRTIEGYCMMFGVRSKLLCEWWDPYYEVLEPGCITKETLDKQDIKLTMYHDSHIILARSKNGVGTLNYEVDSTGVKFWAEMPKTPDGDTALELVKRGDIDGCSFIYSTDEEDSENCVTYEKVKENNDEGETVEVLVRHVKRIDKIYDFTITPNPAYLETSVSRREFEETTGFKARSCKKKNDDDEEDDDKGEEEEKPEGDADEECADKKRELIRQLRKEARREF